MEPSEFGRFPRFLNWNLQKLHRHLASSMDDAMLNDIVSALTYNLLFESSVDYPIVNDINTSGVLYMKTGSGENFDSNIRGEDYN